MLKQKAKILDGRKLADKILRDVRREVVEKKLTPSLAVILVGENPASEIYVKLKQKACLKCGIEFYLYKLAKNISEKTLIESINFLNQDDEINGIIVQLPLPKHLNADKIIASIDPKKDADGFHPKNLSPDLPPEAPHACGAKGGPGLCEGIIKLLQETNKNLAGKKVLIISNNETFAKPFKQLLKKSSLTWLSPNQQSTISNQQSDIIIIAAGIPNFLKADMIKKDSVIIDVGCNLMKKTGSPRTQATCPEAHRRKRVVRGDVDFASCSRKASWISPVPGGVGPITVAMLLSNTVKLYKFQQQK